MSPEQMIDAARKYDAQLAGEGVEFDRFPDYAVMTNPSSPWPNDDASLRHVRWMCQQVPEFVTEGKLEKANRWIGFIQGVLWTRTTGTIASFKDDNR